MPNPMLNEKSLRDAAGRAETDRPGWGAGKPISDGPVSSWKPSQGTMTINGTITATATLLALLLVTAVAGWYAVDDPTEGPASFPGIAILGVIVGFVCVAITWFKPMWSRFLGPVYALAEGFFLGAVSHAYNNAYDGIVVQAAGATIAVFGAMLVLYKTRIIKVTDRLRRIVVGATMGIMAFYAISLLMSLFGATPPFISSASPVGILFSVLVAGLAAFNLALDFDYIERGSNAGLPRAMEWFAALGLLVTIVWLYLEILRLLGKLQRR